MKHFYFLMLGIFFFSGSNAQVINFQDPVFKAKLLQASPSNTIARVSFWPPINDVSIRNVAIDTNNNGEIEVEEAAIINFLQVQSSNITSIQGIEHFTRLQTVDCSYNQLTTLALGTAGALETSQLWVECHHNLLTSIDVTGFVGPLFLYCQNNLISSLDFSNFSGALVLVCANNPLTNLEFGDFKKLEGLACSNTLLTVLDISGNYRCESLSCDNIPTLNALMIKDAVDIDAAMGDMWDSFQYLNCPNLQYLCVSENRLEQAQLKLNQFGYPNCALNSYCDFNAGAPFYTVQGNNKLDLNNNGCDAADNPYPHLRLGITNGTVSGSITTSNGNYAITVMGGSHTITPIIQNPAFFTISPAFLNVNFPSQGSLITQDFCIAPNGSHTDLEILLMGTTPRPGFDVPYTIQVSNKGTVTESGSVTLTFDDAILDLVSANPIVASQALNTLTWNFTNLVPFEKTYINMIFNVNTPMEIPPVDLGTSINFVATVTSMETDEIPQDNTAVLNQIAVNSFDPNDNTCLEGNTITPEMVGKDVHYMIRFENTGTANAENIVVKDIIDTTKFDIASLIPIDGSHPFVTRFISTNKVEFIFENINLPFDDANNDGYVAFKIKTKPTLVLGDTFSNTASIYFDYNFPIITNDATTTVAVLANQDFAVENYIAIHPNPASAILNIDFKKEIAITSFNIYNTLGQLVLVIPNAQQVKTIDVSSLKTGNYFLKVNSDLGSSNSKFIKQ